MKDKDFELIFREAEKSLGFVPNTIRAMSKKPNILGSFAMMSGNIKGFASSKTSPWTGIKILFKTLRWSLQAKKESHLEVSTYLKDLVGHMVSNASGCRYCQAHTAHSAHENSGVSIEKLQSIWEFQTSDLFSEKEKAALSFAMAAGSVPNQVTPQHHERLKEFFTEKQIVEIVAIIAMFGFLNRWNDSMATQLEEEPLAFGKKYLTKNWEPGKHEIK